MQSFQVISSSISAHCLNEARADHRVQSFDVNLTICRCLQHRLSEASLILSVYNRNNSITTKRDNFKIIYIELIHNKLKFVGIVPMGIALGFPCFTSHDSCVNQEWFCSCWIIWVTWGSVFKQPKNLFKVQLTPKWALSVRSPFSNHYSESQWKYLVEIGRETAFQLQFIGINCVYKVTEKHMSWGQLSGIRYLCNLTILTTGQVTSLTADY